MKTKQGLSLVLSLLMLASAAGCSENSADEAKTPAESTATSEIASAETEEETEPSAYLALAEKDFEGQTYTIVYGDAPNNIQVNYHSGELTGELLNDELYNRDLAIGDRYNTKVEYNIEGTPMSSVKNAVNAGDSVYNMVLGTLLGNMVEGSNQKIFHNLRDLPHMDCDGKQYTQHLAEQATINGKLFFLSGDLTPGIYQSPCCMFLNLDLYDQYNIEQDIFQLVIDGEWTFDELYTLTDGLNNDLNANGTWDFDKDFFGVAMQATSETATAFMASANLRMFTKDENGSPVFVGNSDEAIVTGLESIKRIAVNMTLPDINDVNKTTFGENHALFLQHKLETAATHLRDMESPYLLLPTPKLTAEQDNYYSMISGYVQGFFGVPLTADPEFTGLITEALACYSHEQIRPLAYEMTYKNKDARDPRTADVLDILLDNLYIDLGIIFNFGDVNSVPTNVLFNEGQYASSMKSKEKSVTKLIDRFIEPYFAE